MNPVNLSTFKKIFHILIPVVCFAGIFFFSTPDAVVASDLTQESELKSQLEIIDVHVDKDPAIGVPFELHVSVSSISQLENVTLVIDTPGAVQIKSGKRMTKLNLSGGHPVEETFSLVTKQSGEWLITISVSQKNKEFGLLSDIEIVEVISYEGEGSFLREEEIVYVQSDARQPQVESLSKIQSRSLLAAIPVPDSDEIQLKGTIGYESVYYDGDANGDGYITEDDNIPNGAQPLSRAILELWDRHPNGDRLLDITRADENGYYEFYPVSNRDGIDLCLRVYASDYERVRVVDTMGWIIFKEADYIGSTQDGIHTFNYTIPLSPKGSIPYEQAFYVFDLLANVGYVFMENQIGWDDSRLLTVHWPKNCILGTGGACYRGDVYLLVNDARIPDVILHEYGHFVLSEYTGSLDIITACIQQGFIHYAWRESNKTCAWSEGWADFYEMAVQNDPDYKGADHEDVSSQLDQVQRLGGNPEAYENIVAAVLWDIFDSASSSESFDDFFDGWNGPSQNGIWSFSSSSQPPLYAHPFTIAEFWTAWRTNRPDDACYGSAIFQHHLLDYGPYMYGLETNFNTSRGIVAIAPGPGCPDQTYLEGTTVELEAIPNPGYIFETWEIVAGGANPVPVVDLKQPVLTLSMDQGWIVTANFAVEPTPTPTPTPSPTPSPSTITLTITSGDNDAGPNPDAGCLNKTYWNEIYFGECFIGEDITSGFRFINVQIPPGSTVTEAFLRFTTNGPYSNALILRIFGEASASPVPFSESNMPAIRSRTSTYRDWTIPSTDTWGLGSERFTPDMSPIIQEIIDQANWQAGNSIALLVTDNGNEGGKHRRVISFERPEDSYTGHLAELVITYSPGGASPSPTPSPTATEDPGGGGGAGGECTCGILCRFGIGTANLSNQFYRMVRRVNGLMKQEQIPWPMIATLQSLRDEIMINTEEGQQYIDLYIGHSPELAALFFEHDDLWEDGLATIDLFLPALEAMLEGRADEAFFTEQQIEAVDEFLQLLQSYASPDLQEVIETELLILGLSELEDKSAAEAQGELLGNFPPVATISGPYVVDEGAEILLMATAVDPDTDPLEYYWDMDGNGTFEMTGQEVQFSAASLDGPSVADIKVRVCDHRGCCDTESSSVSIRNVAPEVYLGPDRQSFEGSELLLDVQVMDPGIADTFTISWDLGEGTIVSQAFALSHAYGDNGVYEVTVFVEDDDGGSSHDKLMVTILNQSPTVKIATTDMVRFNGGRIFLGNLSQPLEFVASAFDVGSDDLFFEWGFGTVSTFFNNGNTPDAPLSPGGVYPFIIDDVTQGVFSEVGIIDLPVSVQDDDGGTAKDKVPVMILGNDACIQSQGYWKHQLSGKGKAQIDETTMLAYLDIVSFASTYFSEVVDVGTIEAALDVMDPRGSDMRDKAQAQLLAAWLNFADGSVGWTEMIDTDGDDVMDAPFYEVIGLIEDLISDPEATHEDYVFAKDLAESINMLSEITPACN